MNRAPPVLREQQVPSALLRPSKPKPDPLEKMIDDIEKVANTISRFKAWLNTPDPPKKQKSIPRATEERPKIVPPFDLQDIPDAMRKEKMPIGAKLMERWFAGELNYSRTDKDQAAEINQDGKRYPESMVDRKTIKIDWVLKHARARKQYERLLNEAIYNPRSAAKVREILLRYRDRRLLYLHPWEECNDDIRSLHGNFQFQYASVDGSFEQKARLALQQISDGGVPDDLTAALGSFNLYASIAGVKYDVACTSALVTHIIVYVRDSYSFEGESDSRSQYLGHWSRDGVIISSGAEPANAAGSRWVDFPISTGSQRSVYRAGSIHYPVRNKDFREWQSRYNRGGDFIIYSDYKPIFLKKPIQVYF